MTQIVFFTGVIAGSCRPALGQPTSRIDPLDQPAAGSPLTAEAYVPITGEQRADWIVDGTIGPRSLSLIGPLAAGLQTGLNWPSEWQQSWNGVAKRYAQREADVAISNTIEAGLGGLWGEDPRYIPSGRRGIWPRARYAMKTAFLAQRRDGHLAPAWGRYAGNVVNNVIENAWLPPSATTAGQTVWRSVLGLLARLGGNAWEEFWPDVRRRLRR
ncbi:MAG: hypothetical protein HY047_19755 [Acidobacteria bacterium]|nr:hypothetical protein [Acidobacteriota bacterium]